MRFKKEDKKLIARAQKQEVYEDDWNTVRLIGYRCKVCRRVFTRLDDLEVDHIHPRSRGGPDSPSNLRLLCPRCNRKKGSTVKGESSAIKSKSTAAKKTGTVKKKVGTAKKKTSTVKRKQR